MRERLARAARSMRPRDRYQVVQSLKAAGAAVVAWAVTGWWLEAPMALMAPWAAVALVQGTVYRSLRSAVQLFLMIAAGTLMAAGAALLTGNTMTALLIALPPAVLLGNWARAGGQGLYAPTTALFVLAYGSYSLPAVGHRLLETVVGAAVGIAVNALVLPPVHSQHVNKLAYALPRDCARLLGELSEGIREGYDEERAERWYRSAGDMLGALAELRTARGWASESFRLNPGHRLRRRTPAPSDAWDVLWARVGDRLLTLTLWEAASERRRLPRPPTGALAGLSELLSAAAEVCVVEQEVMEHGPDEERRGRRDAHLAAAHRAFTGTKEYLRGSDFDANTSLGSLLAGCRALLDDLTPEKEEGGRRTAAG
ncbi:FUSC family protein [Streptomyces rhizosphaericola]|uniref:FUSC family protein n=1 Tax=Streptomyces rhizosphaericola TaxID=2564098 RepID=UPI0039F10CF0